MPYIGSYCCPWKALRDKWGLVRDPSQSEYAELTYHPMPRNGFCGYWERIARETSSDPGICLIMVRGHFHLKKASQTPVAKRTIRLRRYGCTTRACVSDRAILYQDMVVIPPSFVTRYFELSILPTWEWHRWNHVPIRSYSGDRAYPPPFSRLEIDVAHATKQHRPRPRLPQLRFTRRRLR